MSALSMSTAVSVIPRILDNLEHILRKGEANASERGIDAEVFLNARLAPDMHPLYKQVIMVCDMSKMTPYRITGQTPPVYDESERTFEELYALIEKAKTDIAKIGPDALDGQEDYEFNVKLGPMGDVPFTGSAYLSSFILPNLYFHATTTYNILRQNGVPLGKFDFFGGTKP